MSDKYFGNVLEAFSAGVQLDFRFRVALDILKSDLLDIRMPAHPDGPSHPEQMVDFAFDLTDALFAEGEKRGWVKALPEDDDLPAPLKRHVTRSARVNVHGQMEGQRVMQEGQPKVQAVPAAILGGADAFPGKPRQ
jgi:hypothetical protein